MHAVYSMAYTEYVLSWLEIVGVTASPRTQQF